MRRRFLSRSRIVQGAFWSILAIMVILGIISYRPPSPPLTNQQVEETVQAMTVAELQKLQTATADSWTPTPTFDMQATVSARLTEASNWTATPSQTPIPSATPIPSPPQESQSGFDLGRAIYAAFQMILVVLAAILSVLQAIVNLIMGIIL